MPDRFSKIDKNILQKWREIAELEQIPLDSLTSKVRYIEGEKGQYSFGIILNPRRVKREKNKIESKSYCPLCKSANSLLYDEKLSLLPKKSDSDLVFSINSFPLFEGFSLGFSNKIFPNERPLYTTGDLSNLESELSEVLDISKNYGFQIFHNSPGFGATIPQHEHWHLTNFAASYDILGRTYGFDDSEIKKIPGNEGVYSLANFPFAHLVFDGKDPSKVVYFLSKVHDNLSTHFDEKFVPHTISQALDGKLLISLGRQFRYKSRSSGEVAGHIPCSSLSEFESFNHNSCMKILSELLFNKNEINFKKML